MIAVTAGWEMGNQSVIFVSRLPGERPHDAVVSRFRIILPLILLTATMGRALTIVGYDSAINDRFSSGYPDNLVANSSVSFLGAVDTFMPVYLDRMAAPDIDFSAVPEPSRGVRQLLGACALLRRWHRAAKE